MSSIEEQAAEIDRQEREDKERERLLGKPVEIELELKEKQVSRSHSVRETFAKLVWVRIEFCSIGDIDTVNEKYQAEVRIKAKWYEDDGSINEYDKKTRWYPKLFIENALDNVKEEITYSVTHVEDKCMITETRIAKGYFWERMELQNFPLDIQELSITLASKYSPRKVQLIADPIRISNLYGEAIYTFRDQQKWKLYKICRVTQKASYDLTKEEAKNLLAECNPINPVINEACHMNMSIAKSTKRPKFVASCFCSRKPDYYLYNCFAFNFLITALSLTIFLIDVKLAPNRITGTFTLILTSVSFRWTTSKILPTLAYLTSLDKYQMICILYLVMCCVFHSSFAVMHLDLEKKEFINKIGLACYASVLIAIQIAFLIGLILGWQKIKKIQHEEKLFLQDMQKKYIDYQLSDDEDD